MSTSINAILKTQAVACAIGLVLAAWPGSGAAGIMGTGKDGDSVESTSTSTCESTMDCLISMFGIMGTGKDGDADEGDEVSTLGIMGTGKDGDG